MHDDPPHILFFNSTGASPELDLMGWEEIACEALDARTGELDSGTKDPSAAWFDGIWAARLRWKNVLDRVNKTTRRIIKRWLDRGIR
jgi:hypothetical protein